MIRGKSTCWQPPSQKFKSIRRPAGVSCGCSLFIVWFALCLRIAPSRGFLTNLTSHTPPLPPPPPFMLLYCCAYLPTLWFCARMFDKSNFNPCSQLHGLLRMFDKSNFNPCSKLHGLARMFGKSNFNPCSQLYGSVFDPRRCLFYLPCAAIAFSQPLPGCGDASITHSLCTT